MKKSVKICALILLSLCLAVPVVSAVLTYPLPEIYIDRYGTGSQSVNYGSLPDISGFDGFTVYCTQETYNKLTSPVYESFTVYLYYPYAYMQPIETWRVTEVTYTVTCIGGPEPTSEPTGAYLTSTVLSESASGITYLIKPMPDDGTYLFSRVNTGNPSAVDSTIIYSSEDAAINYKINRGTSQTFNCNYKKGYWGLPQTMSLTLSAPLYSEDVLINATIVNNTLQNLPNPVKPSENNPIRSGDFQPIGKNAIINSPFGNLVTNGGIIFSLPHMESPQQLRENLLNGTGNLTAPLYDAVDSIAGAVLFVPSVISGALSSVVSPLLETVDLLKSVFDSLFEVINNSMNFIYYLLPTVYLLIPDAVWWCIIAVLCYFIFKWILIFVFGNDVINAYFEKGDKE